MSSTLSPFRAGPPPANPPQPKVWTCDQFHALGDMGVFEGRGAMLLDGVILEQGPMNPPHAIGVTVAADTLRAAFGAGWHARVQLPLKLNDITDPEPDVAMLPGRARDYTTHPATAPLVVEVADSSLRLDTTEKVRLYARAAVPDYWVIDVNGRRVFVYRDPDPAAGTFGRQLSFGPADTLSPLAVPTATVAVADLLP